METSHPGVMAAERLEAMVDDLAARLTALPEETFARRPAEGEWCAAEVVAHMTEMMPYWSGAIAASLREPGRSLGRALDDPDRVGAVEGADGIPRAEALARLRHAAHEASSMLRALDDAEWRASAEHYSRGPIPVDEAVDSLIVEHAAGHVQQAVKAAGGAPFD